MRWGKLSMPLSSDTEIAYIIRHSEASVRLSNVIQRLAASKEMPIMTIGEYFQLGDRANELFHNISGMGRKTLNELDNILKDFKSGPNPTEVGVHAATTANTIPSTDSLFECLGRFSMKDIVLRHDLSVRTQNFYKHQDFHKMDPSIVTLGGYLKDKKRAHRLMKQFPNVGKKTCNEVHSFIGKWLKKNLLDLYEEDDAKLVHRILYDRELLIVEPSVLLNFTAKIEQFDFEQQTTPIQASSNDHEDHDWEEVLSANMPPSEKTLKIISAILEERDFEIIVLRYGLGGKKFTLQTLGDKYGVTRERVRQIESRAIKKLRIPTYLTLLEALLLERETDLTEALFRSSAVLSIKALKFVKQDVSSNDLFLIEATYDSLKNWLSAKFIAHRKGKNIVSWSKEDALDDSYLHVQSGESPIHLELLNAILELPWPTSLSALHERFPGCPPTLIAEILSERYKVEFESGYISSIENLPMRHRLVIVLKCVGHGLHTSEIVGHHTKMFGLATNEHAVGAVLMRLDEALITARGVYDLYENLTFSKDDLSEIRDTVYRELEQQNSFISSKKLFEDLFAFKLETYPEELSAYMLHGIIQDDPRFDIRRGLMVGLNSEEYDGRFKSLQEEIWALIDTKGPISIPEMREELSSTRKVLDTTIEATINALPDIFANEASTYDKVERIFGSQNAYRTLLQAIYINLLRGPLSVFALQTKLEKVSQEINERTLRSVLNSDHNISYTSKVATLNDVPEDIKKYANFIASNNQEKLPDNLMPFKTLDATDEEAVNSKVENKSSVFNSILSEFEF